MENENSNSNSDDSAQSLVLMSSLATGSGEVALRSNSKINYYSISKRSPWPMTTSISQVQP